MGRAEAHGLRGFWRGEWKQCVRDGCGSREAKIETREGESKD